MRRRFCLLLVFATPDPRYAGHYNQTGPRRLLYWLIRRPIPRTNRCWRGLGGGAIRPGLDTATTKAAGNASVNICGCSTKARVKRTVTVLAVGSISGTVGLGLALSPFFMLIPGIGFYIAWPMGSGRFLTAVLRYDRWLQRRKGLLRGPVKPMSKGILRRGRKRQGSD